MNKDINMKRKRLYAKYNLSAPNDGKIDKKEIERELMLERAIYEKSAESTDLPAPIRDDQKDKELVERRRRFNRKRDEGVELPEPMEREQSGVIYLAEIRINKKGKKSNNEFGKVLTEDRQKLKPKNRIIDPKLKELKEEIVRLKKLLYTQGKALEFKT